MSCTSASTSEEMGSGPKHGKSAGPVLTRVRDWLTRIAFALGLVLVTILLVRAWDAWRGPPLELWHTEVPQELDADAIDAADWTAWLKAEEAAFEEVRRRVTDKLPPDARVAANRFFADGPLYAPGFATNWNRGSAHRGRRRHGCHDADARAALSSRHVFAVVRRAPVSGDRWSVRWRARSGAGFRRASGTVAVRGERGALVVSNETLMRATWNPFLDYLLARIEEML